MTTEPVRTVPHPVDVMPILEAQQEAIEGLIRRQDAQRETLEAQARELGSLRAEVKKLRPAGQ